MKKNSHSESIIYGLRAIEEILNDSSKINRIEKIYVDERKHRLFSDILNKARENKVAVQYVPERRIEKIARGKNHQGIAAHIIEIEYHSILELLENPAKPIDLILFLDRITDVRNFGAIARSAYAMGADAILIPYKDSASVNSDAIKTSAGALLKIPVCKEKNIIQVLEFLKKNKGFQIIACHEKTSRQIHEVDFSKPSVLILGSEHNGILRDYLRICDVEAKIPMSRVFDSLNVSVSAGILLYEVIRQKLKK